MRSNLTTQKPSINLTRKYQISYKNSYYKQPYYDLTKYPLLKPPEKGSHASKFIKHMSSINIEGNTLLQLQKWWDAIIYAYYQPL